MEKPKTRNTAVCHVDVCDGELTGIRRMTLPTESRMADTARHEADAIARFIRHAIDSKLTVPRTANEQDRGRQPEVEPRDFLIVPRGKRYIELIKEALDRYHLPCSVTGSNALATVTA